MTTPATVRIIIIAPVGVTMFVMVSIIAAIITHRYHNAASHDD